MWEMRLPNPSWPYWKDCWNRFGKNNVHKCVTRAKPGLGKLYIVISDEVERRFRFEVVKRLGGKKGDLSAAIEEALKDWLNKKTWDRTNSWRKVTAFSIRSILKAHGLFLMSASTRFCIPISPILFRNKEWIRSWRNRSDLIATSNAVRLRSWSLKLNNECPQN